MGERPRAWDATPGAEKAWSAWSGEPGMMYWMNKGAWFGAGLLAFLWVCFRFVGPALGSTISTDAERAPP